MKTVIAAAALVAASGIASADLTSAEGSVASAGVITNMFDVQISTDRVGNAEFDITFNDDVASWDLQGDADNVVAAIDLATIAGVAGTQVDVTGVGWDTVQSSIGASWLSEMVILFNDNSGAINADAFNLTISATAGPGLNEANSSGGTIKLADAALGDLILSDGVLTLEFFESFDDIADEVDGLWLAGSSLTIQANVIPAPGAFALLGLGGLATARRRR